MIKEYLELGEIVATQGLKGEMRVKLWCDDVAFLKSFETVYIKDGENYIPLKLISARQNKNVACVKLSGVDSIEKAKGMVKKMLWLKRCDASLSSDRFFVSELLGCDVFDAEKIDTYYGKISEVSKLNRANDVWHIKKGEKEWLIPAVPDIVKVVDVKNEIVKISPILGMFDEEGTDEV